MKYIVLINTKTPVKQIVSKDNTFSTIQEAIKHAEALTIALNAPHVIMSSIRTLMPPTENQPVIISRTVSESEKELTKKTEEAVKNLIKELIPEKS